MGRSRDYLFWYAFTTARDVSPKVIVDVGAIKSTAPKAHASYGYSLLAWLCTEAKVHVVDTDKQCLLRARELVRKRFGKTALDRLTTYHMDGVEFLRQEKVKNIDILSVDGPGEKGSCESVRIANRILRPGALVLLDDCDGCVDGRRPAANLAIELGFELVKDTYRQVLVRKV